MAESRTQSRDEQGSGATKVTEICDRAQVANTTFFNHLPTKSDLLRAIAQTALGDFLAEIEDAHLGLATERTESRYRKLGMMFDRGNRATSLSGLALVAASPFVRCGP